MQSTAAYALAQRLPDPTLYVSYHIINGSTDYMALPASFFILKIPSQFGGHFLFPLSSDTTEKIKIPNVKYSL